jgi:AraC-like DNA-binding protein
MTQLGVPPREAPGRPAAPPAAQHLTGSDLVAQLLERTPQVGPNRTEWPGLTAYRFTGPQVPQGAEVQSLAVCCVVQGRKRFAVGDEEYLCDPFHYLLFTRGMRFESEILEATPETPYLSFVLQIDPAVVRSVSAGLRGGPVPAPSDGSGPAGAARLAGAGGVAGRAGARGRPHREPVAARVSPFDENLMGSVVRFLRALGDPADRRVLGPMCLQEITYRLLQAEQVSRLLDAAAGERADDPLTEVIRYAREHLAEPLTVADLAGRARMSQSALTARFTETTGMGPYQFLKRVRLDRAGTLLVRDGLPVSEVARTVGYTSPSHFTSEFKRFFGVTPRRYAEVQRDTVAMRVDEATSRHVPGTLP